MKALGSIAVTVVLIFSCFLNAAELEGVKLDDSAEVGGQKLILNGVGLRKVQKFGLPIKVYVGGLYLKEKSKDSNAIVNSATPKRLIMEFVRPLDSEVLVEAFKTGYDANCVEDCKNKALFSDFKKQIVNVRKGHRIQMDFVDKEKVIVQTIGGSGKKSGELKSPALVKNLLAIFIGEKSPPTPEFRQGLLGL